MRLKRCSCPAAVSRRQFLIQAMAGAACIRVCPSMGSDRRKRRKMFPPSLRSDPIDRLRKAARDRRPPALPPFTRKGLSLSKPAAITWPTAAPTRTSTLGLPAPQELLEQPIEALREADGVIFYEVRRLNCHRGIAVGPGAGRSRGGLQGTAKMSCRPGKPDRVAQPRRHPQLNERRWRNNRDRSRDTIEESLSIGIYFGRSIRDTGLNQDRWACGPE